MQAPLLAAFLFMASLPSAAPLVARDTPITRVVNLLTEMQATLKKDMEEDEELYDKLGCWCQENKYEKGNEISAAESKIAELKASIESLTAQVAELGAKIKELEEEVAANKKTLAEATAVREKEVQESHGSELDSIQAVENLKAAIVVLSKHHEGAFPQLSLSLLAIGSHDESVSADGESHADRSFDDFMRMGGFGESSSSSAATPKFLQQAHAQPVPSAGWAGDDVAVVRRALRSASAFMQAQHGESYYPSYNAQSGEILGVLKQMKEEMEGDLGEAQKEEASRAAAFAELRDAKTQEIEAGEAMSEQKEDELAKAMNDLAEAKEDLEQTEAALSEHQIFMKNLEETCSEAEKNFNLRKKARMAESHAVSETIDILTQDEARDEMSSAMAIETTPPPVSFLQMSESNRAKAARVLRSAAARSRNSALVMLATSVELDAFTKVKKAIDDMVQMLKTQQEDEVKKNDWCNSELHETEVSTMKTEDKKSDIIAKIEDLDATAKRLAEEITAAQDGIAELEVSLQRASETRKKENLDFQKTLAEQVETQEVLARALDKLATYYDNDAALLQRSKQTPPVPQMEYKPSQGAAGVMQMIEKLIYEAKDLQADAKKGESDAQAAYEALVEDTNGSVAALQTEVATKTKELAETKKEKLSSKSDLSDTVDELERLSKYTGDLHAECDYVMKNFSIRQEGRAQEIEALQQAKQILSGADLS